MDDFELTSEEGRSQFRQAVDRLIGNAQEAHMIGTAGDKELDLFFLSEFAKRTVESLRGRQWVQGSPEILSFLEEVLGKIVCT